MWKYTDKGFPPTASHPMPGPFAEGPQGAMGWGGGESLMATIPYRIQDIGYLFLSLSLYTCIYDDRRYTYVYKDICMYILLSILPVAYRTAY